MDDERKRSVFVGNVAPQTTDALLHELFLQVGPVERVVIPKAKSAAVQASYGFVTFQHEDSAAFAVNVLRGSTLFGRQLNIKLRDQPQRGTPPQHQASPSGSFPHQQNWSRSNSNSNQYGDQGEENLYPPGEEAPRHHQRQRPRYDREEREYRDDQGYSPHSQGHRSRNSDQRSYDSYEMEPERPQRQNFNPHHHQQQQQRRRQSNPYEQPQHGQQQGQQRYNRHRNRR